MSTASGPAAIPREVEAVTPIVRAGAGEPVLPAALARAVAFAALSAWGALHWMSMLEPSEPGRGWTVWFVGLLAVVAMLLAGRLDGRRRVLVAVGAIVPLAALALLAGRVADELLFPSAWGELAGGISRGISDLPGVRVPYRGLDEWVRTVIPLGGSMLVLLAALLAFWPRRARLGHPVAALFVLIALYVVPVVALDFTGEFLRGAIFTVLMVAFLALEKLRTPDSAAAAALALLATFVALVAAPALNRDQPWFDYETWALETSSSKSTSFTWDHTYGTLNWPRDGRELLRVRARQPAYWKAENLDVFDGERWLRSHPGFAVPELPVGHDELIQRWSQTIRVSIRNLRTDQFITAGYASNVSIPRLSHVPTLDGLYLPSRTLRRGDTYTARVYTPRPGENQRRRAGTGYDPRLAYYTTIFTTTPGLTGAPRNRLTFPFFGGDPDDIEYGPPKDTTPQELLERNHLTRTYALSRRLAEGARTPEDYVERVLAYLGNSAEYTYSETPPRSARTLDGFLFDAKTGYCQHYSGAMALLLRMAGIPARVVTGFSTGATDTKTGEYVVRDFDAHSWVEVFYPGWGWLTFDPTPAASPARSQPSDAATGTPGASGSVPRFGGDPLSERGAGVPASGESTPWWTWALRALAVLALAGLVALAARRWRRGAPPALSELERALRRTRRQPGPGTTLHALELRFAATPAAAGYVRALRESRYGGTPAHPTRAQRRGRRSELGRGAGLLGHLRAWWALPPR
ncbi:MAG TPA: transglutaminaseTgpA domain-containing protein [Solirubrobacter sp.]|nr:transglutaminaseTgpA domain-containing protein [Solirubrobacter sp.]